MLGLRREYRVGISVLEVFSVMRSALVILVVAVKMPRLALLVPTRREMDRIRGETGKEREREKARKSTIVSSLCNVCRNPSLPSSSILRRGPAWKATGLQIACQLNHNRDSGSRDNLASGYHGVSSPRPKPKVSGVHVLM
ncbi:Uncharacterized protein DBV15_11405 [Temnothorax longispinosus]|uniref:Uncharacterized protein n=1 Tax=Temnothorax longispinosus TaxID=300112 RepID=A0A4S2KZ83_9HYME|nr:Uncharacterized protein DBV15_11405 [Temnothorax longispinosus]